MPCSCSLIGLCLSDDVRSMHFRLQNKTGVIQCRRLVWEILPINRCKCHVFAQFIFVWRLGHVAGTLHAETVNKTGWFSTLAKAAKHVSQLVIWRCAQPRVYIYIIYIYKSIIHAQEWSRTHVKDPVSLCQSSVDYGNTNRTSMHFNCWQEDN